MHFNYSKYHLIIQNDIENCWVGPMSKLSNKKLYIPFKCVQSFLQHTKQWPLNVTWHRKNIYIIWHKLYVSTRLINGILRDCQRHLNIYSRPTAAVWLYIRIEYALTSVLQILFIIKEDWVPPSYSITDYIFLNTNTNKSNNRALAPWL